MKLSVFPNHFLEKMSPADRRKIGQLTSEEALRRYERGQEIDFKRKVCNWIWLHGGWLFEQPMNKRTRGRRGIPDIIGCYKSKFFAVELKTTGATLEPEQVSELNRIRMADGAICVAFCLEDVRNFLDRL